MVWQAGFLSNLSDGGGADVILTQLQLRDGVLWKAGKSFAEIRL
jgi:hypothetical protein